MSDAEGVNTPPSELFDEFHSSSVAIKQENDNTDVLSNSASLFQQTNQVPLKNEAEELVTFKKEPDRDISANIVTKRNPAVSAPKRKTNASAKSAKAKMLAPGMSPGEVMLRCFQTFSLPTRKTTSQPSRQQTKPVDKKKAKRPPPGLIPIQGPSETAAKSAMSINDEAWEGQANDSGEVILSGVPMFDMFKHAGLLQNESADHRGNSIALTPSMKVFRCDICNYVTNRTNNLNRHYNSMHKTLTQPEVCCDVVFYTRADLTKHNKVCHPDSKFPCQYPGCQGFVFDRKALLKRHVLAVHLKDKPFLCPMCSYGSSHKSNLDRHMKTVHYIDPAQDDLAASALSVPSAGVLEGQNLDSVDDFIGLVMERAAANTLLSNAAFGSTEAMLAGLAQVKMDPMLAGLIQAKMDPSVLGLGQVKVEEESAGQEGVNCDTMGIEITPRQDEKTFHI